MAKNGKPQMRPQHRAKMHVHRGDMVLILTGRTERHGKQDEEEQERDRELSASRWRDKGERGRVERVFPRTNRVIVENHKLVKRHVKASAANRQSGIIEKAMPIHASNVMVICTECDKPTRIAYERVPQGQDQKVRVRRICKRCGKPIQEQTRTVKE